MNGTNRGSGDATTRLAALVRLLDDDTPEVRDSLASAVEPFGGDVSEILEETGCSPGAGERRILSTLLAPARRDRLRRDWTAPVGGARALADDSDALESSLRMLSDFLHDGLTLRPALGDALDLLVDEFEPLVADQGAAGLSRALLNEGRLVADGEDHLRPSHFELAMVLQGAPSNDLAIGTAVLLLADRFELEITAISLPGAFFLRVPGDRGVEIVHPGARGRSIPHEEFAHRIRNCPRDIRLAAARPATSGEILVRHVEDLATAFAVLGQSEDAELMEDILASLAVPGE